MPMLPYRRCQPRDLWLLAGINIGAALIVPTVLLIFQSPTLYELWQHFKYGSVYSWSIGTPSFFAMQWLAPHVASFRPGHRFAAYLLTLVAIALAGSVAANLFFVAAGWNTAAQFREALIFGIKVSI